MIVQPRDGVSRWFRQTDHAELCGQVAEVWRDARGNALDEAVIAAARHHDDGWAAVDDPAWCGTAAVVDFQNADRSTRHAIWTRCVERAAGASLAAGFLTSLHFSSFVRDDADARFAASQRLWRVSAAERGGFDAERLERTYPWVAALDKLSLYACLAAAGALPDAVPKWLTPRLRLPDRTIGLRWRDADTLVLAADAGPAPLAAPVHCALPWRDGGNDTGTWHVTVIPD